MLNSVFVSYAGHDFIRAGLATCQGSTSAEVPVGCQEIARSLENLFGWFGKSEYSM